ncbi:o-acyltransferase [Anaeramoeba ignava]|uniref:O-acyltransferase n=1 Tax=Anaeramoeba ignava TaxID=1746090 RepID=A0A9Q0L7F5_ANAIG|nr:o-acyltransferase [Anaeramoeba ignava]|eukprot:Anaeramoba_ignava/a219586_63.p1 GENE.a219586_63~~a219586_63.p1  ORF type:complete len:658 (+),score=137.08 a219586_63:37-1974(+)
MQLQKIFSILTILLIIELTNGQSACAIDYTNALFLINPDGFNMIYIATGKNIPQDLGDYDLCQTISETRFCYADTAIVFLGETTRIQTGYCVPKSCTSETVFEAIGLYLSFFFKATLIPESSTVYFADDIDKSYSPGSVITFILFALFAALMIATIFIDVFKQLFSKNNKYDQVALDENDVQANSVVRNPVMKFVNCYSLKENWRKLVDDKVPSFDVLNGVRVFSMFWVIFAQSISLGTYSGYNNYTAVVMKSGRLYQWTFQIVVGAQFAADTFFLLTGFFAMLKAFQMRDDGENRYIYYYTHRLVRLLPSLIFVLLVYVNVGRFFGDGPLFFDYQKRIDDTCHKHWFSTIFFFNNFYPTKLTNICMEWTWYLSNDFQFFIIAPIFFILYRIKSWLFFIGISVFGIISLALNGWLANKYNVNTFILDPSYDDYYNYIYEKPYTRIIPFLFGLLLAYFYDYFTNLDYDQRKVIDSKKVNFQQIAKKILIWSVFIIFLILMAIVLFVPYNNYKEEGSKWGTSSNVAYVVLSRFIWSGSLAGVLFILLVYPNVGLMFKSLLSLKIWVIFAKLTFNAFLVHPIIIIVVNFSARSLLNYSPIPILYESFANIVLAYVFAAIVYFLVEAPFYNFEKIIMGWFEKKKKIEEI